MTHSTVQALDRLHSSYVQALNDAITVGDGARAADLAASYDAEAAHLVAVREDRTELAPSARRGLALALARSDTDTVARRGRLTHAYSQAIEAALAREDDVAAARLGAHYDRRLERVEARSRGRGWLGRLRAAGPRRAS